MCVCTYVYENVYLQTSWSVLKYIPSNSPHKTIQKDNISNSISVHTYLHKHTYVPVRIHVRTYVCKNVLKCAIWCIPFNIYVHIIDSWAIYTQLRTQMCVYL